MLALVCSDVGDGGKDIGGVRRGTFDAVSVVDAALSGFSVYVEVLQVVVEIDGASAQIAAEEGSVCGEDGRHVDAPLLAQRECDACKPLVELSNDCPLLLVENILRPS